MRKQLFILALLLVLNVNVSVHATILGEMNGTGSGGSHSIINSFTFIWRNMSGFVELDRFDSFEPFFLSDIGNTKTISSTAPDFDSFVSVLTNGDDDGLGVMMAEGSGVNIRPESLLFDKFVESYGPDFFGYEITSISLTLNDASLNSPGSNPNGDGIWTDYSYDVTYIFYGEPVPEPATLILLGLGAVMLRRKR